MKSSFWTLNILIYIIRFGSMHVRLLFWKECSWLFKLVLFQKLNEIAFDLHKKFYAFVI